MPPTSSEEENEYGDDNDREATEMSGYESMARSGGLNPSPQRQTTASVNGGLDKYFYRCLKSAKTFWQRQVAVSVVHDACRDHFGTFVVIFSHLCAKLGSHVSYDTSLAAAAFIRAKEKHL